MLALTIRDLRNAACNDREASLLTIGGDAMIKRAVIEATDEVINEALMTDMAGRSTDLVSFVQVIDRIEGNYSIFLDAPWGSGKTFFVKEAATVLRDGNEYVRVENGAGIGLANIANLENLHLPVYFNAWECDYRDEPVVSLIETLIDGFAELKGDEKISEDLKESGLAVIKALGITVGPISFSLHDANEATFSYDVTKPLRHDRDIRNRLVSMLDKVLTERAERVVLFIDELDRCRPVYAVRLLEAIKFLFDHERLTVVFSVDCPMLAQAVRGCYGLEFDGEAYLSRFYDMRFRLPNVDGEKQLAMSRYWARSGALLWEVSREIIKRGDLSLRDQLKYSDLLTSYALDGAANESQASEGSIFIRNVIGPLLLCCQFIDPGLLQGFLSGDESAFSEFWDRFEGISIFSRGSMSICQKAKSENVAGCETSKSTFVSLICPVILGLALGDKANADELLSCAQSASDDFLSMLHKLHLG